MPYYALLLICALLPFQFATNPANGIDLAIIRIIIPVFFAIFSFFHLKKKNFLLFKDIISILSVIFVSLSLFSIALSANQLLSLRKFSFLISIFPIYFLVKLIADDNQKIRIIVISLVSGASLVGFIGILQFFAQFIFGIDPVYAFLRDYSTDFFLGKSFSKAVLAYPSWLVNSSGTTYMRALANFPDPHMFSYYMGMFLPWSIALWATSRRYQRLFLITSVILALADIFSFTRGGYVALIAASITIIPLVSKETLKKMGVGILLVFICFLIAPHNPVTGRLTSSIDTQEGSNAARISNWEQATKVILNNPFGVGIGMYALTINPEAGQREPIYAHNLYLDVAAETGIISSLLLLAILFFSIKSFWLKSSGNQFYIAGVASLVIFSVHSVVENPFYSVHILPLFFIILALSSNLEKNYEKIFQA